MKKHLKLKENQIIKERYTVQRIIGSGGMGETYLANDLKTNKEVAIKVLSFSEVKDWKVLELFEREVNALKNLDHPLIPDYFDYFELDLTDEKYFILVQEYVKGKNLYFQVQEGKKFSIDEIFKIFKDLLEILNYIHNLQPPIIHRDINPKNITLDNQGKTYLVDFGAVGEIITTTIAASMKSTFVGTLGYMPTEQFYGKVSPASDIYSLGVTILYLLTGKDPSEFDINDDMKIDFHKQVNIPDYLTQLIDKMIDPNLSKRIQSANEALSILKKKKVISEPKQFKSVEGLIEALYIADKDGEYEKVVKIIDQIDDINIKDKKGRPLLKVAVDNHYIQIAKVLIKAGADVNIKTNGKALIHDTVINNQYLQTKLLLENKAQVDILDKKKKTPLEYAYENNNSDLKELLIQYGAKDEIQEQLESKLRNLPASPRKVPYLFKLKLLQNMNYKSVKNVLLSVFFFTFIMIYFSISVSMKPGFHIIKLIILTMISSLFIMFSYIPNFRKYIKLLKKGILADGTITQNIHKYTNVSINGVTVILYQDFYEYFDEIQNKKKTGMMKNKLGNLERKGTIVPVLYYPKKKDYSIFVPLEFINFLKNRWVFRKKMSMIKIVFTTSLKFLFGGFLAIFWLSLLKNLF